MIILRKSLVTIDLFYYIPDHSLIQEFVWQVEDVVPHIPRVHKFLNYWKHEIKVPIREVLVSYTDFKSQIRTIDVQVDDAKLFNLPN